jgi:hypothetical protein
MQTALRLNGIIRSILYEFTYALYFMHVCRALFHRTASVPRKMREGWPGRVFSRSNLENKKGQHVAGRDSYIIKNLVVSLLHLI